MFISILNRIVAKKQSDYLLPYQGEEKWKWNYRICSGEIILEAVLKSMECNGW